MWKYEKRLQYPVKIKQSNPQMAQFIMSQYGGPDGEIGASMRYLSQRYSMPYKVGKGLLTDIGTEELAHMEIVAAIIHQLTRNLTPEQIKESGFGRIILTIRQESGRRLREEYLSMHVNSSPRETRLPTSLRIWRLNKRQDPLMTTSSVSLKTLTFVTRSDI